MDVTFLLHPIGFVDELDAGHTLGRTCAFDGLDHAEHSRLVSCGVPDVVAARLVSRWILPA
jgi:hypothetical protein